MTTEFADNAPLSPIKRALIEIRDLKARLALAQESKREPIAIVGMGFRLPGGANDSESLTQLLWSATDAITPIPPDRWSLDELYDEDPDAPGKMITRFGGFIENVDKFDAEFFGIAPVEAASMDPQQRLVLEVAWQALENAGHAPSQLTGSRTGVYLGIGNNDYGRALFGDLNQIDPYFGSGNSPSVAAGRLSYVLGLQGPSMAVDTACSASLVAMHLACQSLRAGESDMALAGGVNIILTPEINVTFSKARMMAPDGRCKPFDASADGYVRSEGCAFVVLKRLSDAITNGDRILAVVRGSAINQDGRSGGLTAPNGPAQEAVIRAALADAGIAPRLVGYVEAHGTGTSLGDPIEVNALGAVLSEGRDAAHPFAIGSLKSNMGHLESVAGIGGVIKTILALQKKEIPPHLHFQTGNPHIDWSSIPVIVPTRVTAWNTIDGRRIAGVSSFGFSGTNAHVILEEAPSVETEPVTQADRPLHLLTLSARDEPTLGKLVTSYEQVLQAQTSVADVCFTANTGRSHFTHRLAIVGSSMDDMQRALADQSAGRVSANAAIGVAQGNARPQVAFLFTGQGAQSAGMGRGLYDTSPVFREALDACARAASNHIRLPLLDVMFGSEDASLINDTEFAQPATFAIEYALAKLWQSWSVTPVVMLGHSLGEYAAACIAGLFSLEDGMRLVVERGRLTHQLHSNDAMAAVFASEMRVSSYVSQAHNSLSIAAVNGPEHVVLSGLRTDVEAAVAFFEADGVRTKLLRVPHAAHSALIEPVLQPFKHVLDAITFRDFDIPLISNVTGGTASFEQLGNAQYWLAHMREPVQFAKSVEHARSLGVTHFIEVGPHPVLLGMGAECVLDAQVQWLPSLRRDSADWTDMLLSLQRVYVDGADIDWRAFDRGYARHKVVLPTYPFRARRHWLDIRARDSKPFQSAAQNWDSLVSALDNQSNQAPLDFNASSYPHKWAVLARLTAALAARTLRECHLFAAGGESHSVEDVLQRGGINPMYRHLMKRWLDQLVEKGDLTCTDGVYTSISALESPAMTTLWSEVELAFADNAPVLDYVRHSASLLGSVIRGETSPLETLFPSGSFALAQNLYERAPTARYVNAVAATAVQQLVKEFPIGRSLRVLEVGTGTGGTTSAILKTIPSGRVRYRCSDVSETFMTRARERFGNDKSVEFGLFDIDRDLAAQGYNEGQFDVIVGANVVHACTDLRATLARLRALLAPGGSLVMVETTEHLTWFDVTTGLIEGWQHFADDLRGDNPLLAPDAWIAALDAAGFERTGAWPPRDSVASAIGQHVIVARNSGTLVAGDAATFSVEAQDSALHTTSVANISLDGSSRNRSADTIITLLNEALAADRIDVLRGFIRERVMHVLRLSESDTPAYNARLTDLGFDSLMAVQLRGKLSDGLGLERTLPATLIFDYPTIDSIAAFLLDRIAPQLINEPSQVAPAQPTAGAERSSSTRIAEVAAMSDEEIEALLLKQTGGA